MDTDKKGNGLILAFITIVAIIWLICSGHLGGSGSGTTTERVNTNIATSSDEQLLITIACTEAPGESAEVQQAIMSVILNRANNPNFPDSVSDVINQAGQFGTVVDGQFYQQGNAISYDELTELELFTAHQAFEAAKNTDNTNGALFYYKKTHCDETENQRRLALEGSTEIENYIFMTQYPY